MPTNNTGINGGSFNNTIPSPVAGEFVTGASVQQVAVAAANQDKWLYDRHKVGAYTFDLGLTNFAAVVTSASYVDAGSILVDTTSCVVGDVLLIDFSAHLNLVLAGGNNAFCKLVAVQDFGGAASASDVPGTTRKFTSGEAGPNRVHIGGYFAITTAGTCRIKVQARVPDTGGSDAFDVEGWAVLRVMKFTP